MITKQNNPKIQFPEVSVADKFTKCICGNRYVPLLRNYRGMKNTPVWYCEHCNALLITAIPSTRRYRSYYNSKPLKEYEEAILATLAEPAQEG